MFHGHPVSVWAIYLRVKPGYVAYLASPGWSVSKLLGDLIRCDALEEAIFVTKPSILPVITPSRRVMNLAIPPSSIILGPKARESCHIDLQGYTIAEESWVDGKSLPAKGSVAKGGCKCLLIESLERIFGELSSEGRCHVTCGGNLEDLIKSLQSPNIVDLSTVEGLEKGHICGEVRTFWKNHPVLYGLSLPEELCLGASKVSGTALRYYAKPLAYIDGVELLLEVPYSSSILFAGYRNELLELAVRAVLYSC